MPEARISLGIRVTPALYQKMLKEKNEQRATIQRVVELALEEYLAKK